MNITLGFSIDSHYKDTNPRNRKDNYFQSLLDKEDYVLKNVDYLFKLGDTFDAPIVSTFCTNKVNMLLTTHERKGKKIKLLEGNHDKLGQNKSLIPTSLGSLIISNPNRQFKTTVTLGDINIVPIVDYENIPEAPKSGKLNILCGHALFETPDEYTLTKKQLYGYDICILGHDHLEYPEEEITFEDGASCVLIRMGSLARKDRTPENLTRQPQFLKIKISDKGIERSFVRIPYKQGSEIFTEELITGENDVIVNNLDLEEIKEVLKGKDKLVLYDVLKSLNLSEDIIELIQEIRTT